MPTAAAASTTSRVPPPPPPSTSSTSAPSGGGSGSGGSLSPTRPLPPFPNEILVQAESQWLFSEEDLLQTPSVLAGLSPNQERENRAKGVNFILQVGIMLKLPQLTLAAAAVFLHRFFMRYSMIEDKLYGKPHGHYYSVAGTALFLATKVEENCRKMKDLVVACVRVAQKQPAKEVDEQDKEFWRWRDTILQQEDLMLEALCFDLSLDQPYTTLFNFLLYFRLENNKPLRNAAWAFVNDSTLTPLCLLWSSRTIAASAIYAAARHCSGTIIDDRDGKPWWVVMGVELLSIRRACNFMAAMYENAPLRGPDDSGAPLYQRTPEDGDEMAAKTRKVRKLENGGSGGRGDLDIDPASKGDSAGSVAGGSETSRKRSREPDPVSLAPAVPPTVKAPAPSDENSQATANNSTVDRASPEEGGKRRKTEAASAASTAPDVHSKTTTTGGENGTSSEAAERDGTQVQKDDNAEGLVSPKLNDDGSEEGELEQ